MYSLVKLTDLYNNLFSGDLNDNAGIKNVLEDMEADGYSLSDEDLNSFSSK